MKQPDLYYFETIIKGSIEPTHGSVCSDVRKLQSMDVLKLQSAKADWNTWGGGALLM